MSYSPLYCLRSLLLVALLSPLATGCAALNGLNVKKPTATFRAARVENVTAEGLTTHFDVNVENPNGFAIPVSGANYKLGLGGVQVVDGKAKPEGSIPANGSLPVSLPVRLSFQNLLAAEQSLARSGGNIPYDFDGGLDFAPANSPFGQSVHVPLKFSGTLPVRDIFQKALTNPDILRNPDARKVLETVLGKGMLGGLLDRFGGRSADR